MTTVGNPVARSTESDVPPVGGWGLWPTFRHTESIKETSEMDQPELNTDRDEPAFEDLLASPHLQFDPDGELLPHLLAFGPPKSSRPWLFDVAVETTVSATPPTSTPLPERTDMAKVTIAVETSERQTRATRENDDEALALAHCIYQIAEASQSRRVAALAEAVYRVMHDAPSPR